MTAVTGALDWRSIPGHDGGFAWIQATEKSGGAWDVKAFIILAGFVTASFVGVSYQRGWSVDLSGVSEVENWLAADPAQSPDGLGPASSNLLVALADDEPEEESDFTPPAPPVIPAKPAEAKPASPPAVKSAADSLLDDLALPSIDEMSPPAPEKKAEEPPTNPTAKAPAKPPTPPTTEATVIPPAPPTLASGPKDKSKPTPAAPSFDPLDPQTPSQPSNEAEFARPPAPTSRPEVAVQPSTVSAGPPAPTSASLPRVVPRETTRKSEPTEPSAARKPGAQEDADDVIARSQPLSREELDSPASVVGVDRGKPIASSAAPEGSTTETLRVADPAISDSSFTLLQDSPRGYIPVGAGSTPPRRMATLKPLGEGEIARMGSRVVDQSYVTRVYKTDAGSDLPTVTSYDVTVYRAAEGDTFESIARAHYRSSSFGEALARYNHSRQSPSALLSPRSQLRIPPRDVLESQFGYPDVATREGFKRVAEPILGLQGSRQETAEASKVKQRVSPSPSGDVDANASPFDENLARSLSSSPVSNAEYRVDQEETLWSIAKKRLGDGRRWKEIYQLNRDKLTSDVHVPIGVTLKLPTE